MIAGIIGWIIPVIPGWPLLIPGLMLLGFDLATFIRWLEHGENRFPRHRHRFQKLRELLHRVAKKESKS